MTATSNIARPVAISFHHCKASQQETCRTQSGKIAEKLDSPVKTEVEAMHEALNEQVCRDIEGSTSTYVQRYYHAGSQSLFLSL